MGRKRKGVALSLCVLALASGMTGCGGDDGPSEEELREAREEGEKAGRDRQRLRDLEREVREREKNEKGGGGGGSDPGPSRDQPAPSTRRTNCGDGVEAGPNTTCVFARIVRDEYNSSGGSGSMSITAYSPATNKTYTMSCTGGSPHVCTGGNNASVYFP